MKEDDIMPDMRLYAYPHVETALCIWEWINEVTLSMSPQCIKAWCELRSEIGSVHLRSMCITHFADYVQRIYKLGLARNELHWDGFSYDWNVVPAIMRTVQLGEVEKKDINDVTLYEIEYIDEDEIALNMATVFMKDSLAD